MRSTSEKSVCDEGLPHRFFKSLFLYWLEALSLVRWGGAEAMNTLYSIVTVSTVHPNSMQHIYY